MNYLRVKAFPFNEEVQRFLDAHDRIYVVEQNRDAQLRSLLLLETDVEQDKIVPVLHYDGLPITPQNRYSTDHQRRSARGGGRVSYIAKPKIIHARTPRNKLGLTIHDYEGGMSTLCAGCGHDSVTGALVQAAFELSIEPHRMAKLSGIGCSSKTPAYFLSQSHGFNSVHGRMPSVATGANAANRGPDLRRCLRRRRQLVDWSGPVRPLGPTQPESCCT